MSRHIARFVVVLMLAVACTKSQPVFPIGSVPPRPSPSPSPVAAIIQMPNVVGLTFADASAALHDRGLKVKKQSKYSKSTSGQVLAQSRKVGEVVDAGAVVRLTVAIPIPAAVNGNPWGYNFGCCKKILDPPTDFCSFFACVLTFYNGTGYVVQCQDDQYSATGGSKKVCSGHDGHKRTLLKP